MSLNLNGRPARVQAQPDTPLLWVLRDHLALTGTKYGCGIGACGACTVHVDGQAVRACVTPWSAVGPAQVHTIEHAVETDLGRTVLRAWLEEDVAQCGWCQPGQVMGAIALLRAHPSPTDEQIDNAMNGHLCRCGTYVRIRRAIRRAARLLAEAS